MVKQFPCDIHIGYGATEGIIMYNAFNRSSLRINNGYKYLISGYENIKIVDSEENTVENGQSGEIVIKGPYTINKYFNVDDNTMDKFTYDGFYRTGDKAIFNEYGEYEIIGRIVDQINRAGEKINPQEIENYLCECAGVKEAVVVGVKDELLGERICAFVIPDKMKQITDGAELKKNLEVKGIARYKLPDQILLIDSFPVTPVNKIDKANILFPKGEMDPALAAYHDNQINKMLNDIAKAEIGFLCREKNQNKKRTFRILEVGAGVGGTSLDVIPSLDGMEVEYYFTDLSTFFLNRAQDNFGKYDWVKYGIFDINKEFAIQGYDEFSFDLILCANVLHNSRNIHDVMENLKGLLTDNGSMVILEETRTSYILLTSMEFKDGLTGFTDERAENEQTFFTRNQWESVFASHKGEIVFEFPSNESKLDLSGQTIYVTRFVNELEPIRKHDVRMYLEEQVSPYMVPANILVIPEIPLTSNRKVDTKAVKNYFMGIEETNKKGGTELPQTDLEKRIADIWCKELNISNIGRNDSFYLVGGDSLLIAQVIGKMLEKIPEAEGWEWSALLTEMMQTPTIKGIAEKIEAFQKDTDYVIDPCLVQLKKSVKENSQSVAKVLFHAGTGTLTPYNALLSYIEKDSKENEAIIGFTFGDDADYISMETSQTFRLLGEKYGKILNKFGYSNYILIGHCVGGLIALETAQYLQKKNVQVSDVTLISSNIPKQKNQTILSQATDEIYRKTLQSSLDNEILLERIFAKLIGADAYKAGYQVDEERLQQYIEYIVDQGTGDITVEALCNTGGKFEDVAKEFRLLASKSVSERLNALYNIIERPNGELMEHQLKMLNILFRVFSQNFRCVSTYEPKPYYGNMRILCCEIQGGHFYPGFFAEDYETWKPYAKGNLTFDLIKGWHLDCITEPNLGENIKKMLDFNY